MVNLGTKLTLGRSEYLPLSNSRSQRSKPTAIGAKLVSPRPRSSMTTASATMNMNSTALSSTDESELQANRKLNIAELVMSAYIHGIISHAEREAPQAQRNQFSGDEASRQDRTIEMSGKATQIPAMDAYDESIKYNKYYQLEYVVEDTYTTTCTTTGTTTGTAAGTTAGAAGANSGISTTAPGNPNYTTEARTCYCYSFLSLWYGVHGEEWLVKTIDNITLQAANYITLDEIIRQPKQPYSSLIFSPYHLSIANHLYRNSLFYSLCMLQRYVAVLTVDLRSLKDISYKIPPAKETSSFVFSPTASSSSSTSLDVYAIVRVLPASKVEHMVIRGGVYKPTPQKHSAVGITSASTSPVPSNTNTTVDTCRIDPKKMVDAYITPTTTITCDNRLTSKTVSTRSSFAFGDQSGSGGAGGAGSGMMEYIWNDTVTFRYPLPLNTTHINARNSSSCKTALGMCVGSSMVIYV